MLRWLWKVVVGVRQPACSRECQWEIKSERDILYRGKEGVYGTIFVLRCKTCGLLTDHRVDVL